jgi:hypothetical protein
VAEYAEANARMIEDGAAEIGTGWSLFIDFDIAGVGDGTATSWWKDLDLEFFTDEVKQRLQELQSRQTDKGQVFERVALWLAGRTIQPVRPVTEADWSAIAETVFWVGRLNAIWPLQQWLLDTDLDEAVDRLPLEVLADLAAGLSESRAFPEWLAANRKRLIERFRRDTQTVALEDDGKKLTARFILVLPEVDDAPAKDPEKLSLKTENAFHDGAVKRLGLLRRLLPDREEFASQGYGHMLWDNFLQFDETIKTGIARKHLPLVWLSSVNGTFRGVADLKFRPHTWLDYSQSVYNIRCAVINSLKQLQRGIETHFRRRNATRVFGAAVNAEAWDACKKMLNNQPRLPRAAVDEWGFVDESTSEANSRSVADRLTVRSGLAAGRYKTFLKSFNEHTRTLRNFFSQAIDGMTLSPFLRRSVDRTKLLETAASLGLKQESAKLATLNLAQTLKNLDKFQLESRKILGPFFHDRELDRLERDERETLRRLWYAWYFFAQHPEKVMQNALEECARESLSILRTIRLDLRARLRRISTDSLRFSVVSEEILWDDQPALWMTVDAHHPLDVFTSLTNILEAVRHAVQKVGKTHLRRYILDMHWPYIVIVPLVRGKYANANSNAWRISLPVIVESDDQSLNWWNYAQHQIPAKALDKLKIACWDLPELGVGAKLVQSTMVLFQIAAHIRDFRRLPDLDEEGFSQLQTYVNQLSKYGSEALQSVIDTEADMLATFNNLSQQDQELRPHLLESVIGITNLHGSIMPAANFSDHIAMDLRALIDWASRLEQAPGQALAASSAWMSDALDQAQGLLPSRP